MNDDEPAKPADGAWPPPLDARLVEQLVGKRLLIGLTYLEANGDVVEQKQLHGVVEEISMTAGIVIRPLHVDDHQGITRGRRGDKFNAPHRSFETLACTRGYNWNSLSSSESSG